MVTTRWSKFCDDGKTDNRCGDSNERRQAAMESHAHLVSPGSARAGSRAASLMAESEPAAPTQGLSHAPSRLTEPAQHGDVNAPGES